MNDLLENHKNDTIATSTLIEGTKYAEEEITKGGEPYKTHKLTYLTLKYKMLKKVLRFLITENDYTVHDVIVVITDDKFIKYIQVNFLDSECDEDSKYKPYVRFYREKVFYTEKRKSNKENMPEYINVSTEMKEVPEEHQTLRETLFKLIYKMIFNGNKNLVDKNSTKPDQFRRRIKFL